MLSTGKNGAHKSCSCQHADLREKSRNTDRCTRQKKDTKEFDRLNYFCKRHPWIFSDADCYETQSQTSFDHSFRLMISPDFNKVCHPLSNSFVGLLGVRHSKQLRVWFSSSSSSVFFNLNINLIILFHHVITAFIFICFFYLFIYLFIFSIIICPIRAQPAWQAFKGKRDWLTRAWAS